jgi:hypothetical protein
VSTTQTQAPAPVYPDVVDEIVDQRWWKIIEDGILSSVSIRNQEEDCHLLINKNFMNIEKSSMPKGESNIGVVAFGDPIESAKKANEDPKIIEDMSPFLTKNKDTETIIISPNCTLDLQHPDLEALIYKLFIPKGEIAPGVELTLIKKD